MREFKLYLGRMVVLRTEGKEAGVLDPEEKEERYGYIAFSKVDKDGKLLEAGFQTCHAKYLAESLKDDPLFEEEAHIEVWKYHQEKLYEFDGTLYDALLVAANEGAKYDV
ncbi:hypothetical protein [Sulfurimonas sp.]|uniref:hypothetical protein n=1 Tax=Sulfurimonas sp. TaxID=2022749 RepID=UPI002611378E|nr:hypothetical protein [Sulfurimonas sp.]MDD3452575.1 hypothetical protein [Sulfurimonas sp.]